MARRYMLMQDNSPSGPNMWPDDKGEWVTYADYEAVKRALNLATKLLKELEDRRKLHLCNCF